MHVSCLWLLSAKVIDPSQDSHVRDNAPPTSAEAERGRPHSHVSYYQSVRLMRHTLVASSACRYFRPERRELPAKRRKMPAARATLPPSAATSGASPQPIHSRFRVADCWQGGAAQVRNWQCRTGPVISDRRWIIGRWPSDEFQARGESDGSRFMNACGGAVGQRLRSEE